MKSSISKYGLYSEAQSESDPEFIHIEDIRTRAARFDWHINTHTHPKMFQLVYVKEGSVRVDLDGVEQNMRGPCLITVPQSKGTHYEERFKELICLVEKHYKEHRNMKFYAAHLNTTPMGISRACSATKNKQLTEILHDRVILEAQRFLIYTAAPSSLIAYELGFKDPAYFSRFFKRRVGMTPGKFRDQRDR